MNEYFTEAEYREQTADRVSPYRVDADDIMRGQVEVVNRLEKWARSAWPNVASPMSTDGAILIATPNLTIATGAFGPSDVGLPIKVVGAGAAGADLDTTILAFVSSVAVTLADDALTTVGPAAVTVAREGFTLNPRTMTFKKYLQRPGEPLILLPRRPVIGVSRLSLNGVEIAPADVAVFSSSEYTIDLEAGILRWGDWYTGRPTTPPPHYVEVDFQFGFTSTPDEVKRPCIFATETLLRQQDTNTRIPRNVTSYTTDATSFKMDGGGDVDYEPWPWDMEATSDMCSYWKSQRPRGAMSVSNG
jgi:hypothetical protein